MNINHKQKILEKPLKKAAGSFYILILSAIAVVIGIQFGNLWYRLDLHVIDNIDTQSFKGMMNMSLPIMETVYNSGKSSVSLAGEIKGLMTGIFGFDLDAPATIFNAQSPIFMNYYRIQNMKKLDISDQVPSGRNNAETDSGSSAPQNGTGGDAAGQGQNNTGDPNGGKDPGTGQAGDGNSIDSNGKGKDGTIPNSGDLSGSGAADKNGQDSDDGSPESSISMGTNDGAGQGTGWPGIGDGSIGQGSILPSISSISWEVEDEEEDDKTDTVEHDKIAIKNFTKHKIDIAKLLKEPVKLDLSGKGPKVMIYHTHTSESYVLKESDLGKKNVPSFNSNPKYSVVRVGEELARHLKKYGIETLHNGTVHDKVRDAAYGVAIDTLQSYKKSYPSIQVYIDVHRDAVGSEKPKLRMTKEINGKNCAQIMFVVGADGTLPHPQWEQNLKFVFKLQQKLNEKYPGLAKPVWIVAKRYNQHVSNQSILIEVGGDGNLLSECLESTKYLAEVLNEVINEK